METSPLTCFTNQWTGVYRIGTSNMKELILLCTPQLNILSKQPSTTNNLSSNPAMNCSFKGTVKDGMPLDQNHCN